MSPHKEKLKKAFPHLTAELEQSAMKMPISSVRSDVEAGEDIAKKLIGYNPDVVDFIRRCDTMEQANEIINFMERRSEITREYAERLRCQLYEKGVRSFGSKKEPDYYFRLVKYG